MPMKFKLKIDAPDNSLKFGDIIYIDDRSKLNLAAHIIRYIELGGKFPGKKFTPNHVMMVAEENPDINKVRCIQAYGNGVCYKDLGLWLKHSKVNTIVKRYNHTLTDKEKTKLHNWYVQQLGKGYDWGCLIGIFIRYLLVKYATLGWLRRFLQRFKNPFNARQRFICSEFICLTWLQIKIKLCPNCTDVANTTPYDVYQNKKFTEIYRNYNYSYMRGEPVE